MRKLYDITNENINAIRKGMNPQEGDNIFSVCGGGDIPFMFLEAGANVFAVDRKKAQINHVEGRIDDLVKGDFEKFNFRSSNSDMYFSSISEFHDNYLVRDEYFSGINHEKVRNNLYNLNLKRGDIFSASRDVSNFNKVYLSNVCDYVKDKDILSSKMNNFTEGFKSNTLFYLTHLPRNRALPDFNLLEKNEGLSGKITRENWGWDVLVFRKK